MNINDIINRSSYFNQGDKKSIKENGVVFTNRNICDLIIEKINPKIDIVNSNVIDVKSTVITANQNILSVKTDLSLVSQKVINLIIYLTFLIQSLKELN